MKKDSETWTYYTIISIMKFLALRTGIFKEANYIIVILRWELTIFIIVSVVVASNNSICLEVKAHSDMVVICW